MVFLVYSLDLASDSFGSFLFFSTLSLLAAKTSSQRNEKLFSIHVLEQGRFAHKNEFADTMTRWNILYIRPKCIFPSFHSNIFILIMKQHQRPMMWFNRSGTNSSCVTFTVIEENCQFLHPKRIQTSKAIPRS